MNNKISSSIDLKYEMDLQSQVVSEHKSLVFSKKCIFTLLFHGFDMDLQTCGFTMWIWIK